MADRSNERNYREHWRGSRYGRDWDEAAAEYQTGDDDRPSEGRSFDKAPGQGGGAAYTGRGYTGGYGQNGTDPGERVSPYGDRVYRGDGGRQAQDYSRGGRYYGDDGRQGIYREEYGQGGVEYGPVPAGYDAGGGRYDSSPRQDHPGEYRTYRDPGHRGLGPLGYTRSDQRINEDVHDRLTDDDHIDASGIAVAVQDGEVTLSGTIRDRRAKHHAEAIIEHIGGVKHVQNNLRVDASAGRAPAPMGENTVLRDQAEGKS